MMNRRALLSLFALGLPTSAMAQALDGEGVRRFLLDNPEVLEEAFLKLQEKRRLQAELRVRETLQSRREEIFSPDAVLRLDQRPGDKTILEFADYNCGFCRKGFADIERLMAEVPALRHAVRHLPLLSQGSRDMARFMTGLAKLDPDLARKGHPVLMGIKGQVSLESGLSGLEVSGVIVPASLRARIQAMTSTLEATLSKTTFLARDLGVNGTPTYLFGTKIIVGAVGFDQLRSEVKAQYGI